MFSKIVPFALLLLCCLTAVNAQKLWLRLSHTSPDTAAIDVLLNGTSIFNSVSFHDVTDYKEVQHGLYDVKVKLSGTDQTILHTSMRFDQDKHLRHTLVIIGEIKNPTNTPISYKLLSDDLTAPAFSELTRMRIFHAVCNGPAVDIRLDGLLIFSNIGYSDASDYLQLNSGTYFLEVYPAGSWARPLLQINDVQLKGGRIYSLFIEGLIAGTDNAAVMLQQKEDIAFDYLQMRVAHASPDTDKISVYLDDANGLNTRCLICSGVKFKEISSYLPVPLSNYLIKITQYGKEQQVITTLQPELNKDSDCTLTLAGFRLPPSNATAPLHAFMIKDNNAAPTASDAVRVRFVHVSPGSPSVDIRFSGGDKLIGDLAYTHTSSYHDLSASPYKFDIYAVGSPNTPILSFSFNFLGGRVYTVFLEGVIGSNDVTALSAVVRSDKFYNYFTFRAAHTAWNVGNIDVLLDGNVIFGDLAYGSISSYKHMMLVPRSTLKITRANHHDEVLHEVVSPFLPDQIYTISLVGNALQDSYTGIDLMVAIDEKTAPASNQKARVRFIHTASNGAPAVDVRFNDKLLFRTVNYRAASKYKSVDAGNFQIKLFSAGSLINPLLSQANVKLEGGKVYTMYLEGALGEEFTFKLFEDFGYEYTVLRVGHASPNLGAVDVLVNGCPAFTNIDYNMNSEFIQFIINPHHNNQLNITIVPTGSVSPVIYESFLQFGRDKYNTLMIIGLKDSTSTPIQVLSFVGDWDPKTLGVNQASISIAHFAPGVPPIDFVMDNGKALFADLEYGEHSKFAIIAANTYRKLQVIVHDTKQLLLSLPATDFMRGHIYSIYIEGIASSTVSPLVARVVSDYTAPKHTAHVRLIQASHEAKAVDVLFDGESKIYNIDYEHASSYVPIATNIKHEVVTVPSGNLVPHITKRSLTFHSYDNYTLLLCGSSAENSEHPLETLLLEDQTHLPSAGQIKIRFVHAVYDAPALDVTVKAGGDKVVLFKNMKYGDSQYTYAIADDRFWMQLFPSVEGVDYNDDNAAFFGHDFDFRTRESAIYTVVATGSLKSYPRFNLISFLDAGTPPSNDHEGKGPLSGPSIALIVVGVILAVVAIAAVIGFIVYRQRKWHRKGYSSIQE